MLELGAKEDAKETDIHFRCGQEMPVLSEKKTSGCRCSGCRVSEAVLSDRSRVLVSGSWPQTHTDQASHGATPRQAHTDCENQPRPAYDNVRLSPEVLS